MHDKRTIILTLIAALFTSTMQAQYQYRYWFDQDAPTTVAGTGSGTWNVNARNLAEGFHTLRMMVSENGSNVWSSPRTLYFVKAPAAADLQPMTYVASVDGRVVDRGTVNASNGTAVINVDVNDVANGFHCLNMVLLTKHGVAADTKSAYFWKRPTGGNHIIKYEYWLNDGENMHVQEVASTDNPFLLDISLDLGDEVFSSRRYAFAVVDNKAYAWAKNKLTVRFFDVDHQSVEVSKDVIDFRVGGLITGPYIGWASFEPVIAGTPQTVAEPAPNTIHWFQTYVNKGDSITLTASRACMLEAYAPDGAEVYATDNGTRTDGFRAKVSGTHYVALHDVAVQNGSGVTLTITLVEEQNMPTEISTTDNDSQLLRTETFAPDGTQVSNDAGGLRIIRKTYEDGKVSVEKRRK